MSYGNSKVGSVVPTHCRRGHTCDRCFWQCPFQGMDLPVSLNHRQILNFHKRPSRVRSTPSLSTQRQRQLHSLKWGIFSP